MKKYNRSEIFKAAWKMVKEAGKTISEALKRAWYIAKHPEERRITMKAIDTNAEARTIEAVYREARGYSSSYCKNSILEAIETEEGKVHFQFATSVKREKTAKTNRTQYLTYELVAGAEDGNVFGINWDNVTEVSGQTYDTES